MTDITPDKLNQAREWASWLTVQEPQSKEIRAAAEVINALPDEWIDAEKVRGVLDILDQRSDAAYRAHKTNPEDVREDGKAIAYEQAVSLIQHALGGTL